VITDDMELSAGSVTPHELNRIGLRRGQVLMTKDSESWDDIAVPAYVSQDMPEVVCGYHLAMVEPLGDELDGEFFCWAAQTDTINDHYKLEARGVTRFGLGHYAMKNVEIGFPSADRQHAINSFLREKTAEIDDLIAKKRSLLTLLAEKRSALITRAVTKGLDRTAPMKPSGVDWLGDIPAHWEAVSFKWRCQIPSGQVNPTEEEFSKLPLIAPDFIESGTGILRAPPSAEEQGAISGKYHFSAGTVVYSKIRPLLAKVCIAPFEALCSADMYPIRPSNSLDNEFLFYQLLSGHFTSFAVMESLRVAMPKVNRETLGSFPILIPPIDEQTGIVAEIKSGIEDIDKSRGLIERAIDQFTEYRAAIITRAVTGELEVT